MLFMFSLLLFIFSIPLFISSKELNDINFNLKFSIPELKLNFLDKIKKNKNIPEIKDKLNYAFKVLDQSTDAVLNITLKDFTIGAVATEMPLTFEAEALKAQAVATYTYFSNLKEKNAQKNDPTLKGADFSVDSDKWLYYTSKEQMQLRWGENFNDYYEKLCKAVEPVLGQSLKQDGKYIQALYHSISSGNTEDIMDVFGGSCEYLKPVPSPEDLLAPGYLSYKEFALEEFKTIAKTKWPDASFSDESEAIIQIKRRSPSGMIIETKVGSRHTSGREIRDVFGLRSANFDVNIQNDKILFTVKGYGLGVGMSQYGAQNMAKNGANYKKILSWYYPGAELCS